MKRFLKPLWIGLLIGAVELGAVGLMAGVGKWAAYDEAKTMEKLPPLSGNAVRSVAVFVAAAVVLAGFGVSLLF